MEFSNLNDLQRESRKTWNLIHTDHPIVYFALGLANEAGEVAGKVKKIFHDKNGVISDEDRDALKQELGYDMLATASVFQDKSGAEESSRRAGVV